MAEADPLASSTDVPMFIDWENMLGPSYGQLGLRRRLLKNGAQLNEVQPVLGIVCFPQPGFTSPSVRMT